MTRLPARPTRSLSLLAVCALLAMPGQARADDDADRHFTLKVLPVLKEKCLGCHGGDPNDIQGGFSILSRAALLRGGDSEEAAVIPGNVDAGTLLPAIRWDDREMPPKENDRLTSTQIEAVRQWIRAGAPWPDEAAQKRYRDAERSRTVTADGVIVQTSGGTSEEWTSRRYRPADLWAWRPVHSLTPERKRELLGDDAGGPSPENELIAIIDTLIDRKLNETNLPAAPQADPRTLIRRATFDLHGLPPTPEEVAQFVAASERNSEAAWRTLIDRLLASPRFGERQARHWLDVTRYADTGGMSNDYERSNMWRYRDYVIRSFNADKPYDQFVIEQLAGDELADASVRERTTDESTVRRVQETGDYTDDEAEWIVASGFLRLGPWDNAMVDADEARQIWLDDLVNATGQTFLSTTMRCLKCHDHKFDPLPTRDYYRMYAAFSSTHMAERNVPFLPSENLDGLKAGRRHVRHLLDFATREKNKLVAKREAAARAWFEEHDLPYKNEPQRKSLPDDQKPPRHVGLSPAEQGRLKVREQDQWIWQRRMERYEPMAQSVYTAAESKLAWNGARKLRINRVGDDANPPAVHILTGGALSAPGDAVTPGVLSAAGVTTAESAADPFGLPNTVNGRRLGLARWIAHPENPLATRSIVNRLWQSHFGTGLAANPNNFGAKGAKPSHPELLDHLTADFVQHGWRMKRLHRAVMLTRAYRRASTAPEGSEWRTVDPTNRLLSRFPRRRLTAEELRDGMLFVTGELTDRTGGLPIRPEINMEVALQPRMIQFSLAPAYQPSATPQERNARSIFAYKVRGQADPFLESFNQPNPNESCERREEANVSPQALTLMNSDLTTDRSIAFALRLERERKTPTLQIGRAFELAFGREATPMEIERLDRYRADMVRYHREHEAAPVVYPTEITRSLVEEFTGQPFEYREILPVFANYRPDVKPADVSAETRALADVCLLLLNANEFLFIP